MNVSCWNSSCNHSCLNIQLDVRGFFVAVILSSISVFTVCGNVLVLLAVALNRNLRTTTTIFVANLAIADLLLGSVILPFSSYKEVTGCWVFGTVFCDIWAAVDVLCCTASILSLCAISMDRYIGVTRPLRHSRILTRGRALCIVLGIWSLSLLVSVGPLFGWQKKEENPFVCEVAEDTTYILFSVSFSFYLPLCIIIFFYIRIYKAAVKQTRFLASGVKMTKMKKTTGENGNASNGEAVITLRVHRGGGQPSMSCQRLSTGSSTKTLQVTNRSSPELLQSRSSRLHLAETMYRDVLSVRVALNSKLARFKREKKAAKTLGIVVGVFIMCWLPFFFLYPFGSVCKSCEIPRIVFDIVFWLGYCNSLCNPIIYACWNREFKRAFIRILKCRFLSRQRKQVQLPDSSYSNSNLNHNTSQPLEMQKPWRNISDESYYPKCSNCPTQRPQSPLVGLLRADNCSGNTSGEDESMK